MCGWTAVAVLFVAHVRTDPCSYVVPGPCAHRSMQLTVGNYSSQVSCIVCAAGLMLLIHATGVAVQPHMRGCCLLVKAQTLHNTAQHLTLCVPLVKLLTMYGLCWVAGCQCKMEIEQSRDTCMDVPSAVKSTMHTAFASVPYLPHAVLAVCHAQAQRPQSSLLVWLPPRMLHNCLRKIQVGNRVYNRHTPLSVHVAHVVTGGTQKALKDSPSKETSGQSSVLTIIVVLTISSRTRQFECCWPAAARAPITRAGVEATMSFFRTCMCACQA